MLEMLKEHMPKSEGFWLFWGLAIVVICMWKTKQINAVMTILQDETFNEIPEEEKEKQIKWLKAMLYAFFGILVFFIGYSLVDVMGY
jgi:hypothetical protein